MVIDLNNIWDPDLKDKIQKARAAGIPDEAIQSYVGKRSQELNTVGPASDAMQLSGVLNQISPSQNIGGGPVSTSTPQQQPSAPIIDPLTGQRVDLTGTPDLMTPDKPKPSWGQNLLKFIPALGGIGGGIAGAELGPVGMVGGGAIGQAGGKALQNLLEKKPVGQNVSQEGITGGLANVLGLGMGKVLGPVGEFVSNKLGDVAEGLGLRAIRPTASQLTNFASKYGEKMDQALSRMGLLGADSDAIATKGIKPLQEAFSNIVDKSGVTVDRSALDKNFLSHVNTLLSSPSTEDHSLAEKIVQEYGNITDKLGSGPIPLSQLNDFRQVYDSKVKNWLVDPIMAGKNRLVGNALRDTIQQGADSANLAGPQGQSLKQLGMDLSKLYSIQDIAERQANLGKGTLPLGLSALLEGGLGAGVGSVIQGVGSLPGALGGILLGGAINNPKTLSLISKMALGASGAIDSASLNPVLGKVLAPAAGEVAVSGGNALTKLLSPTQGNNVDQTKNNNKTQDSHTSILPQTTNSSLVNQNAGNVQVTKDQNGNYQLPPISQIANQIPGQPHPPEEIAKAQQAITDNVAKAGYDPLAQRVVDAQQKQLDTFKQQNDQYTQQYVATHQLDPGEVEFMRNADTTNRNMNLLRGLIQKITPDDFSALVQGNDKVIALRSATDPDIAQAYSLMNQLRGQAVRAIEGGRPSNFDIAIFNNMPKPGQTQSVSMRLLDHAQEVLVNQYSAWAPMYGFTTQQPSTGVPAQNFGALQQQGVLQAPQQQPTQTPSQTNQIPSSFFQGGSNPFGNSYSHLFNTLYGNTNPFGGGL